MNQELLHLIEQISREKGVEKSVVIDAVLSAVLSAARKRFGTVDNINARLDEETGAITLFSLKTVRDEDDIVDDSLEISLEEARDIRPDATIGSVIEVQHDIDDFGRIAAQTAKGRLNFLSAAKGRLNFLSAPEVLRRAQEVLNTQSASETIREALNLVALRQEVMHGFDRVAGKNPGFRDMWQQP